VLLTVPEVEALWDALGQHADALEGVSAGLCKCLT
jgi:hypothetical protein